MNTYCGASCEGCGFKSKCSGCAATCGSPFGGTCVAAEYIKAGGMEAYKEFKEQLMSEINALLALEGLPETDGLCELSGEYINLEYSLPSGGKVKLLNDKNIYLGAQTEIADTGICCGVAADTSFILICTYGENGSDPELVLYKHR